MHIPDGYLSPATCAVGFAIAVPAIGYACRRVARTVRNKQVPTLAMLSAVSFLVMMFNIPIPDGTSAHAVGGALVSLVLGPWAAVIAVSVALLFQALLFGDGGVLAYGINVVNMAVVLPFVAVGVYRLVAGRSELTSRRRLIAAGVAGYLGLTMAGLMCGIQLGVQPLLFHAADGTPLYSPYGLAQAVPAMLFAHLSVAGFAEAVLTAGVVAYLQRANLPLWRSANPGVPDGAGNRPTPVRPARMRPGAIAAAAMGLMVILTPLGLLAPGGAFGEDAPQDLDIASVGLNAVPTGLARYAGFWEHTVLDGYGFTDGTNATVAYLLSALIGVVAIGLLVYAVAAVARTLAKRSGTDSLDVAASSTP